MAIVSNTFLTYDAVGIREELADVIYDISPMDTPVLSMSGKENVDNTNFEWQTDSLSSTDTGNAQLEGDDISSYDATPATTRVGNYVQISRKTVIVSGTEQAVDTAGRRNDLARRVTRAGQELKRDLESIILENQAGDAGGSSTARKTATLGAWLQSNTDFEGTGADSGHSSGIPTSTRTDGAQRALTETMFQNVLETAWTNGADIDSLVALPGAHVKGVISGFSGISTPQVNVDSNLKDPATVIAAVDLYVSDFGNVRIMPQRFGRGRDLYLLDFDFLSIAHLRPFQIEEMSKTGDADKRMMLQEWGLKVKNEAALAAVYDLSTS